MLALPKFSPGGSEQVFQWWQAMDARLRREAELVAEFPHMSTRRWWFLAEGPGLEFIADMTAKRGGPLKIYRLTPPELPASEVEAMVTAAPATRNDG